jgi:hypothetical protein
MELLGRFALQAALAIEPAERAREARALIASDKCVPTDRLAAR